MKHVLQPSHLSTLLLTVTAAAQAPVYWVQPAVSNPSARTMSAMACDPLSGNAILFGGHTTTNLNDTWQWNGYGWTALSPAHVPEARSGHCMVYDTIRQREVMYLWESNNPSATWEWYAGDWHQVITGTWPSATYGSCMAYDAAHQQVLLFGGASLNFTNWTYDGASWNQTTIFPHPPGRAWSAMAYDAARQRVVLFGGYTNYANSNDTWEWDGTFWTQRLPFTSPPARRNHKMVYDSNRQRCVMFGGSDATGAAFYDVWEYDGTNWVDRTNYNINAYRPPGLYDQTMTYDASLGVTVMFGGGNSIGYTQAATWLYGTITPGEVTPFGQGCPGQAGTPVLQSFANTVPVNGGVLEMQLVNVGANPAINPAFVFLGLSDTTFGGAQLPVDLTAIGMPGCTLLTSLDVLFGTQGFPNGVAVMIWNIGHSPALLGATFFAQGLEFDATANAAGLVLSNACRLVVGGTL